MREKKKKSQVLAMPTVNEIDALKQLSYTCDRDVSCKVLPSGAVKIIIRGEIIEEQDLDAMIAFIKSQALARSQIAYYVSKYLTLYVERTSRAFEYDYELFSFYISFYEQLQREMRQYTSVHRKRLFERPFSWVYDYRETGDESQLEKEFQTEEFYVAPAVLTQQL